jgi:vacuolar protein sorting-associated protein 13A/C
MFCESLNRDEIRQQLAHSVSQRTNHTYILEPVQLHIKLKLNQRPESDGSNWSIPKVDLSFYLKILAMFLVRQQYKDFLAFLESWNRFILSTPYLKYRPNLNVYRGHYREW